MKAKSILFHLVTVLLWIASAVLGLYTVTVTVGLAGRLYVLLAGVPDSTWTRYTVVTVGRVTAITMGILWLGMLIVTAEYYLKKRAERASCKPLGWVLGVELFLLALNLFI